MRKRFDPLITGIIIALIAGLFLPVSARGASILSVIADIGVGTVFLFYGLQLATREVIRGLTNIRLQGSILAMTFVIFPVIGIVSAKIFEPFVGEMFATGILYVALLPSTIQSSVTFVSIARGNVAGAVAAATISNVAGMFLTPLLVLIFMDMGGASTGGFTSVLYKLLLPFIVGQLLQPFVGDWMRARRHITKRIDTTAIIIVVFSAVVKATRDNAWSSVTLGGFIVLFVVLSAILALALGITWYGGRALKMDDRDRIVTLFCGTTKSLATGIPMAKALFDPAIVGAIAVPVIIFHQLQLTVSAVIARRLGATRE
ncbi:MAG: bile acid:sodium symporter [Actinomycetaceae bacterium]|nr:bile acid:sodium symporter [Actinomycetaceae bacterium]